MSPASGSFTERSRGGTLESVGNVTPSRDGVGLGYLLVFVVALAVGAAVYVLSVREMPESDGGFGPESSLPPPPAGGATTYVPVTTSAPDWQTRLQGVLGLAISIVLAALGLALAVYAVGSAIARAVSSTASSGVKGG